MLMQSLIGKLLGNRAIYKYTYIYEHHKFRYTYSAFLLYSNKRYHKIWELKKHFCNNFLPISTTKLILLSYKIKKSVLSQINNPEKCYSFSYSTGFTETAKESNYQSWSNMISAVCIQNIKKLLY